MVVSAAITGHNTRYGNPGAPGIAWSTWMLVRRDGVELRLRGTTEHGTVGGAGYLPPSERRNSNLLRISVVLRGFCRIRIRPDGGQSVPDDSTGSPCSSPPIVRISGQYPLSSAVSSGYIGSIVIGPGCRSVPHFPNWSRTPRHRGSSQRSPALPASGCTNRSWLCRIFTPSCWRRPKPPR